MKMQTKKVVSIVMALKWENRQYIYSHDLIGRRVPSVASQDGLHHAEFSLEKMQ